jgi:hypothetical protein
VLKRLISALKLQIELGNYDFLKTSIPYLVTTTSAFECPEGTFPMEYNREDHENGNDRYNIERISSDLTLTTTDVTDDVLQPCTGAGLCQKGLVNLLVTLTPPRSANMFIHLTVKGATSVSLIYTTDSTASDAQTVRLTLSSKD